MPEAAGNLCFAHTQNRPQHLSGLSGSTVMRQSCADTLAPEEPDAFITHVRVCGGAGWVTIGSTRKPTPSAYGFRRGSPRALGAYSARGKKQRKISQM